MALRNQEIGARLRELRGEKPQTTVADELGVAERTYQNWEAGDAKPSYRNLQKIADYFGVGENFILTGEGAPPAPVGNGTPDPFAGAETQLDRIERRLNEIHALLTGETDEFRRLFRGIVEGPGEDPPGPSPAPPLNGV